MYKVLFSYLLVVIIGYSYGQAPVNDKCAKAIAVSPSSDCVPVNSTLSGATVDPGYSLNDVWFSFVATATSHAVSVVKTKDIIGAKVFKPDFQLYDACGGVVVNSLPLDNTTVGSVPNPQNRLERTYTGLVVGKTYYYRVYNAGGGTEFEFNTSVCTFKNLGDVNDLVGNAIELQVSQTCNFSLYTLSKSTKSNPEKLITAVTNSTWQFSDVWFKAKVPANGRISVILQNVGIDGLEAIALYTSPDNGVTLSEVASDYSSGALTLDRTGLTPNTFVYIRVCATNVNALLGTFNICVSTPPECGSHIPAGDNCSAPTRICDLNGYCGNTSSSYTIDLPGGTYQQHAVYGGATIENNSWLSFIASETSAKFTIYVSNCKAGKAGNVLGIQAGVYEGNCASIVPKSNFWSSPNMDNNMLTATNLTVGNEYYIMLDGNSGATCDYIIATNSGVQMVDAGPDQIYCNPNTNPLELNAIGIGTSNLTWSSRAGTNFTSNIGSTANLSLNPGPTEDTRYIVEAKGTCTGTKDSLLVTISNCLCVKPVISTHPTPVSTCPGSTISFSITTTGATSFQWKESTDGGVTYSTLTNTGIYSGVTSATLTLTSLTSSVNGYKYKCIIKDVTGFCSDSSTVALLTISPLTTINSSDVHVCTGSSTTISATTIPSTSNIYVWTVPNGVTNPGNVNSFLSSTPGDYICNIFTPANKICNDDFELPVIPSSNWQNVSTSNYSCWGSSNPNIEVWSAGNMGVPAFSGKQFVEINSTNDGVLFQNISLTSGSKVDISFAHRGRKGVDVMKVSIGPVGGPYTQLGQYSTDNTSWVVYSTSYTVTATGNYSLRFESVSSFGGDKTFGNFIDAVSVKTGICAVATSKITLINDPLPLATKSNDIQVCKGDLNSSIVFSGLKGTPNYTFTYNINGGTNQLAVSNGNNATISVNTTKEGVFKYNLIEVKDNINCRSSLNDSVTVKIDTASIGGIVSSSHTVCIGSSSNQLTLTGKTGLITKWQYAISPFTSWIDTAILTSTFTSGPIYQSTKFRAVVKSGTCPEAFSTPALVSVDPKSIAGTLGTPVSVCAGQTGGNLTLVGNGNTILKWQSAIKPYLQWNDIVNTTNTYTSPVLNDTTKFRVLVKSGVCPPDTSNLVTISVMPKQVLNLQCGDRTNNSVQFTWDKIKNATNYTFSYTIDNTGPAVTGTISATTLDTTITVSGMGKTVNFTLTPIGGYCTGPETANCISTTCVTPKTDQLPDIIVCAGDNVDIPVFTSPDVPESFSWTNSNSAIGLPIKGISDTLFKTALVTQQEIGIIKVNAFKNPCKGPTMTFKIIVNPLPTISTILDTSICKGSTITLKGKGAASYTWDNGIQDNIAFAPTSTNTYKVNGIDVNGCKNFASVKVNVNNLPSITVTNSGPICANDTVFSLGQSGDVLTKWSWKSDANALFSDSLIKQPVVKKAINNELFTLVGYDVNGCKASAKTTFTINPLPIFNVTANTPCVGQDLNLSTDLPGAKSYAWTHKNSFSNATQNPIVPSVTLADTGLYSLKLTDANSCSDIRTVRVGINELPVFSPNYIVPCENKPLILKANYTSTKTVLSYVWTGPTSLVGVIPSVANTTITLKSIPAVHNGEYGLTVTDENNCSATQKVTITINPLPQVKTVADFSICIGDEVRLSGTGALTYFWDNNVQDNNSFKPQLSANYIVKGLDVNLCENFDSVFVTVNPLPSISVPDLCEGYKTVLTSNHLPATSNAWISSDVAIASVDPSTGEAQGLTAGKSTMTFTDNVGCKIAKELVVNATPSITTFPLGVCENSQLILKANQTPAVSNPWKSTSNNLTINSVSGQVFGLKAGVDSVSFTNNKGCKTSKLFTVYGLPIANFSSTKEICIDDTLRLLNTTSPLCETYVWDFGDGIKSTKANHKYSKDGFFTISLSVVDSHGCQDSIVKLNYVEVVNKPYVSFVFTPDSIDILNPEVRFKTKSDGKYYKWHFGDGKPTSITKDAIHFFPTDEGKYYTVTLTASNTKEGCSNIYTQVIVSKEPLIYYIPNTFTPNGDEFNNTFKPIFSSGLDPYNYTLFIYDRWGELIYESHNAQIGWDGTYNNQIVGSNTYIWKLNFKEKQNGQEHTKLGHVNVIR